jgi:hypothetical protein
MSRAYPRDQHPFAAWVEGIADGNEVIRELVKVNLLNLARM